MITLLVLIGITVAAVIAALVTSFRDGYRQVPAHVWVERPAEPSAAHVSRIA